MVSTREARFASPVDGSFRDVERPLDRLYPPEVELAQQTNHGQSENRPVGLGLPHRAGSINPDDIRVRPWVVGVVNVWMDSDPGM